ncbi:1,4-dihydroxy-2-naphthoate polyprenyltransferase [candidate division KSB1 bacterium]
MGFEKLKIWILAARPKTLWAGVSPVIIGSSMAYYDDSFHLLSAFFTLIGALLIQIGTNLANDYYDFKQGADSGERLGPERMTQKGLVKPETMKRAFILTFTLAVICGSYLIYRGGYPILLIGILSILFGILYTGGPFPLGYNGLGDIFVLIFFGPVAVGGTYYVQSLEINNIVLIAGLSPGLISVAILTVNNLRDINTDRDAGKRSLAVRYGAEFARSQYLISIVFACVMPVGLVIITDKHYFSMIAVLTLLVAIPSFRTVLKKREGKILNKVLADTGKILLIYGILFSIGWNI